MRVGRQSICRPTPLFGEDPFPDRRPDVPGAIRCPAGFFGKALPTGPALADGPRRGNRPIRPSTMGRLQPTSGRKTDYCESMHLSDMQIPEPLTRMADGTIKQRNPFTGTEAWTVPGRADRPLPTAIPEPRPVTDAGRVCPFCPERVLETPPEKARILDGGEIRQRLPLDDLADSWAFRRVANLFEIVSYDFWEKNYGYQIPRSVHEWMERYMADPAGRAHVQSVFRMKKLDDSDIAAHAPALFGGGHDLILSHRHYLDGATDTSELAGAGTLTPDEHADYWRLTIDAMHDLYRQNRYVAYVQVFQNWLKPSGASFDHLHKQLVSIDQRSVNARTEIPKARANPNLYNEYGVDYASKRNLVIAENRNAVAIAGFGHRYPTLEVWSRSAALQPFEHTPDEARDVSDLVHAMHAATGTGIPSNEEWYCAPRDTDVPMPWRVLVKWRVSTLAGFEGGTKIYVNTIDPWTLRDRVVPQLLDLRAQGAIAQDINIATECSCRVNSLKYNPALH